MSLLDKLERIFGRFAISNLTLYIVIGQVFVLLTSMLRLVNPRYFVLVPAEVMEGRWWELFSMLMLPPPGSASMFGLTMTVFGIYLFYMMGSALEGYWGEFRFNVFIFCGYVLTVGAAFITPQFPVTNLFILTSVFLAFAWLNPDFELLIFFILPVKIKWLALVTCIFLAVEFAGAPWWERIQIIAMVANFLLFFSRDIVQTMRYRRRQMARSAGRFASSASAPEARHVCRVCGKTDVTNPELDFRYCSKCAGDECYCPEHIFNHVHVTAPTDAVKK